MAKQSYIIRTFNTRTCKGFCNGYENARLPIGIKIRSYALHNRRYCSTCEHVFKEADYTKFPYPRYCVCCHKPLRTRVYGSRTKDDWRKRY